MRTRTLLAAAAVLAACATPASAAVGVGGVGAVPSVRRGACDLDVTNGSAECLVQLDQNTDALFGQSTWSGYGEAVLFCHVSGNRYELRGGYGSDWVRWSHGPELCRLRLTATGGRATAYVD